MKNPNQTSQPPLRADINVPIAAVAHMDKLVERASALGLAVHKHSTVLSGWRVQLFPGTDQTPEQARITFAEFRVWFSGFVAGLEAPRVHV